jgi:hypothetical protein
VAPNAPKPLLKAEPSIRAVWNRKMARRLARWDGEQATPAERELARAAERAGGRSVGRLAQA